jgi:hypothetical protein
VCGQHHSPAVPPENRLPPLCTGGWGGGGPGCRSRCVRKISPVAIRRSYYAIPTLVIRSGAPTFWVGTPRKRRKPANFFVLIFHVLVFSKKKSFEVTENLNINLLNASKLKFCLKILKKAYTYVLKQYRTCSFISTLWRLTTDAKILWQGIERGGGSVSFWSLQFFIAHFSWPFQ